MDAHRGCLLSGRVRTKSNPPSESSPGWSEHLTLIQNGDWAAYKYVDFGDGVTRFRRLRRQPGLRRHHRGASR